jgi:hypothetical protein
MADRMTLNSLTPRGPQEIANALKAVSIAVGQHAALAKAVAAASRDPEAANRMNDAAARCVSSLIAHRSSFFVLFSLIFFVLCRPTSNRPLTGLSIGFCRIARAMQELVNSTKMVITNPNDPAAKKAFADGVRSLQSACAEGTAITLRFHPAPFQFCCISPAIYRVCGLWACVARAAPSSSCWRPTPRWRAIWTHSPWPSPTGTGTRATFLLFPSLLLNE